MGPVEGPGGSDQLPTESGPTELSQIEKEHLTVPTEDRRTNGGNGRVVQPVHSLSVWTRDTPGSGPSVA